MELLHILGKCYIPSHSLNLGYISKRKIRNLMEHSGGSGCYCRAPVTSGSKGDWIHLSPLVGNTPTPQQTHCVCWSVCCILGSGTHWRNLFSFTFLKPQHLTLTHSVHSSKGKHRAPGLALTLSPRVRLGCGGVWDSALWLQSRRVEAAQSWGGVSTLGRKH